MQGPTAQSFWVAPPAPRGLSRPKICISNPIPGDVGAAGSTVQGASAGSGWKSFLPGVHTWLDSLSRSRGAGPVLSVTGGQPFAGYSPHPRNGLLREV